TAPARGANQRRGGGPSRAGQRRGAGCPRGSAAVGSGHRGQARVRGHAGQAGARLRHRLGPGARAGAGGRPRLDHRHGRRGRRVLRPLPCPGVGVSALDRIDDLTRLTVRAAELWPDRTAWVFDTGGTPRSLTFAEVNARSDELAGALAGLGVAPGDRVALMLRNGPDFPLLWLATAKLGAAMVPVNINYRELDGAHVLSDSGARVVICEPEFADMLRRIAPDAGDARVLTAAELPAGKPTPEFPTPAGERPVNIQYTSGTTGAPKGCVLPHRYWTTLARGMITEHPTIGSDDVMLTAQPFHYIDPQWHVALGLAAGARLVVPDRFHPSTFWAKVREHAVTSFYCLGMMPTLLLRQPPSPEDKKHRVRAVHASAIPRELHAELEQRWGVPWFESFGMTETGADIRMRPEDHDELVGSGCIGSPVPGRDVV